MVASRDRRDLARRLDQTVLRPQDEASMVRGYLEAAAAGCAAFVTHAWYLPQLREPAAGRETLLSAVIDFPFGLSPTDDKLRLITGARAAGAGELELVINQADAAAGRFDAVRRELAVLEKASRGLVRKVIIESAERDPASRDRLARLIAVLGFEFVKTSTGYTAGGATLDDVRALRETVAGTGCRVKASGGIRTMGECLGMLEAGADRIGTSRALEILREAQVAGWGGGEKLRTFCPGCGTG